MDGLSQQITKLTGKYELVNMVSGIANLDTFLFRTPKWPIGGVYFDGIMRTEHVSRVRPTQYPVQTGVTMTDHAIIEPAELTIEVMMSDCHTTSFVTNNIFLDLV
ncbi:phage baseplate protein [Sporomusa aerivorans]|uniref:phage baseplate protein n=1 Tax=Sporomusa aerivorans TaxID=204936 RepID=UPI00352BB88F